jgi:hypothetical protein
VEEELLMWPLTVMLFESHGESRVSFEYVLCVKEEAEQGATDVAGIDGDSGMRLF